jgi:hypothetical protein
MTVAAAMLAELLLLPRLCYLMIAGSDAGATIVTCCNCCNCCNNYLLQLFLPRQYDCETVTADDVMTAMTLQQ